MSYPRATVRQSDLTRYMKAWKAAGYAEPRVEIKPDGTVVIVPVEEKSGEKDNDWD